MSTPSTAVDIHPVPTAEEAAVIAAAVEMLWPKPLAQEQNADVSTRWRFSRRHWQASPRWGQY